MPDATPRAFLQDLLRVGPHNHAHLVAVRAAVSVFVPLALLALLGRYELTAFAAFGAFTALYGRTVGYRERAGMQLWVGGVLTLSVAAGVVVSGLPHRHLVVVAAGALLAAVVSTLSDGLGWHPPGPLFPLFAFCVCAAAGHGLGQVPLALGVAAASAAFSLLVGQLGAVRNRASYGPPILRRPALLSSVAERDALRHLTRYVIAVSVAGAIATAVGGTHPYWAMVAAVAALGGPDLAARLVRGAHRVIGTLLGLVMAALLLSWYPQGFLLILIIAGLQLGAELLIGRNYALALIFVTPLALAMGQLVAEQPIGPLLWDRGWETALGAAVAMVVLFAVPSPRSRDAAPEETPADPSAPKPAPRTGQRTSEPGSSGP